MAYRPSFSLQAYQYSPGFYSSRGEGQNPSAVDCCPCRAVSTSGSSLWTGIHRKIICWQRRWSKGVLTPLNLSRLSMLPVVRTSGTCVRTGNSLLSLTVSRSSSINLSKATRLKDVYFRVGLRSFKVGLITTALRTITPEHRDLRQISIYVHTTPPNSVGADIRQIVGGRIFGQWLDLDRLLVQTWESFSVRPRVLYAMPKKGGRDMRYCFGCLLPEVTKRGMIGSVETCIPRSMWWL